MEIFQPFTFQAIYFGAKCAKGSMKPIAVLSNNHDAFQWDITMQFPNSFGLTAQYLAFLPCKFYGIFFGFAVFNCLGHTLIAFNRFSHFCCHERHASLWSGRCITFTLAACFALPFVAMTPFYVSPCVCIPVEGRFSGPKLMDPAANSVSNPY